jgi:hypothetical protein
MLQFYQEKDYSLWYIYNILPKNEFYSVLAGFKKASYHGFSSHQEKFIPLTKAYLEKQWLFYHIGQVIWWEQWVIYAKTKENLEWLLWQIQSIHPLNFWLFLGYPDCCVYDERNKKDRILWAFMDSQYLHRQLNSIYNYNGRGDLLKTIEKNNHITTDTLSLISHLPHSFDCEKSLSIATAIEKVLMRFDPKYLAMIQEKSQKIFLYFWELDRISLKLSDISEAFTKQDIYEWIIVNSQHVDIFQQTHHFLLWDDTLVCYWETWEIFSTYSVWKDCWVMDFRN